MKNPLVCQRGILFGRGLAARTVVDGGDSAPSDEARDQKCIETGRALLPLPLAASLAAAALVFSAVGCASNQSPAIHTGTPPAQPAAAATGDALEPAGAMPETLEPGGPLTLRAALALAVAQHPELAVFAWQERAIEAQVLQAGLRRNPELRLDVEDVLGTGEFRGGREAQTTLQLSQAIELGGKRNARVEAASQARGLAQAEYELKRVEVLGDVTRRFIDVVASQHALDLALTNRQLAEDTFRTVQERVRAGKASALEERKAEVALARGEVLVEGARHDLEAARKQLAARWRSRHPAFTTAQADLFARPPVPPFESFAGRIASSPTIARFASEKKLREAEIRLADARRRPDITVGGGVRRFEGPDDVAFVFGASMPLQLFDRNQGAAAEARALLGRTEAEQQAAEMRIGVLLIGLYEEMVHDGHIMEGLQREILPKAEEALALARDGFEQGRFSYLEVLDAQRTIFEVRQEYIQTATSYHQLLVEIERLVGQPLAGGAANP